MVVAEYPVAAGRVLSTGGVVRELGDGRVDYVLEAVAGVPAAVVEAKREYASPSHGLQQAVRYAQQLDVPVAYASNGRGIIERNLTTGRERAVDGFRTPAELWAAYCEHHGLDQAGVELVGQPFDRGRTTAAGDVITPAGTRRWPYIGS